MKKNRLVLVIIVILFVSCASSCSLVLPSALSNVKNIKGDNSMNEFKITDTIKSISNNIFDDGCVRNEKDAVEIATVMFKSIYGETFDYGLPLIVNFDDKEQVWLIKTQLPENMLGGSKYIIIKKSSAEVVAIWATK